MAQYVQGVNATQADETAKFALGQEAIDPRVSSFPGNVIKYVKAAGTIAATAAVHRDVTATDEPHAVLATTATGQVIQGVSIVALASSGTNQYGWITIHGKTNVLTLAVAAAGTTLATTGTAGTLDDFITETNVTAQI